MPDEELEKYGEYIESVRPTDVPQSQVYELIMRTVYTSDHVMRMPSNTCQKMAFILFFPLTSLQYVTVPNPMLPNKENFYPLTLVMSLIWVWFYTYLIVWWTYEVTQAYELKFSILPMVIYPFGIALRDMKKFSDLKSCLDKFSVKLRDQKLSLAETYAGQVFQITGLMGFTWMCYLGIDDSKTEVTFINESIQYQFPLLIIVVIVKFLILASQKFRSSKKLFYINLLSYTLFLVAVLLIDYRSYIWGE